MRRMRGLDAGGSSVNPFTDWLLMASTPAVLTAGRLAAGEGGANGGAAGHVPPIEADRVGWSFGTINAGSRSVFECVLRNCRGNPEPYNRI